jgi:2-polyprenyl-3-methyl-5-hydroxy-6-metoxy-1,4-benzoquinol methylase
MVILEKPGIGFWEENIGDYFENVRISMDDVHYAYNYPGESELRLLGEVSGKRTIEVGCGGGHNTIALAKWGALTYGIDMSQRMIMEARKNAMMRGVNSRFDQLRAEELDSVHEKFDISLSAYVFDYIEDVRRVISNVGRLLDKGGLFILSFCHPSQMPSGAKAIRDTFFIDGVWPGTNTTIRNYFHPIELIVRSLEEEGMRLEELLEVSPPETGNLTQEDIESWPYCTIPQVRDKMNVGKEPHTAVVKASKR